MLGPLPKREWPKTFRRVLKELTSNGYKVIKSDGKIWEIGIGIQKIPMKIKNI